MGFKNAPMTTVKPVEGKENLFSPEVRAEIDSWIAKYPEQWRQSAVMAALRIVQDANGGYLTEALMDQVAAYLDMPAIAVYEVATFYSMYELKPVGRHKVCVCTNVSCMVNGSDKIVDHMEQKLGIKLGETTEDGRYTLKEVECLGACGGAPMFQIGTKYYENLTPELVDSILDGLE
ncbi:MAG: NADH-quinone oxidoreductase subunit NuoE [Candidatus Sedimenticola endophacoides]|uniref:NADH-quinone oxidoreductase subunit E n=2 Tax=Candidatus Sedimenticola endophacoides TaxID=2548426 RepID=A0A657PZ25_9GAMM|nr:MAG: NADH-quinone oxidoreductase subunit E [Candidatus Sedimenticola endophacoides]OQX35440.1 MAG: NADH-quinone oxidoreductase subunit E [Candidatus Sedimenticola endophacoides]OQX40893.1 MAG: NADH-quinone oxidoreductase subunit E [Candidatus Sedimenticola endophacoides]OQX41277.1 MAG: NADH-quinone oxidoreductase subunit E [Candidatus Sedimenticola endophacoides]OQX43512.1 MAG: NADH-quinone oxidoreductase subunit E [Candidatus Sedimenticola endophacoides]